MVLYALCCASGTLPSPGVVSSEIEEMTAGCCTPDPSGRTYLVGRSAQAQNLVLCSDRNPRYQDGLDILRSKSLT